MTAPGFSLLLADLGALLNVMLREAKSLRFPNDQQFLWSLSIV